jgi:DNA-binding response OmpR family regulator
MSGLDLLELMRSRGNDTPLMFVTAFPSDSIRARAAKAGADMLLDKPFSASVLIDCIKMALTRDRRRTGS